MASSNCWRCLARPNATQLSTSLSRLSLIPSTSFSTTTARGLPMPAKKKTNAAIATKGQKTLRIKKKAPTKREGKAPASGERKAMRKRIVLSNTNALEVEGMRDLDAEMVDDFVSKTAASAGQGVDNNGREDYGFAAMVEDVKSEAGEAAEAAKQDRKLVGRELIGKVVGLKGETVDSLRAVEAFKITQGWGLFRRPGVLVREESVALMEKMAVAQKDKTAVRMVMDGEKGAGKSIMLLHAMATAFVKGWIVINIPEAQDVTNAHTDYAPIPGTNPTIWSQNTYIANVLTQIRKANSAILEDMEVNLTHTLPVPLQSNISLARLCELGARDPEYSWPFFQAFWAEITAEGRPPVMMCLDGLQHIMQNSSYLAPDISPVHAHDLAIIKHFLDHLSGQKPLPNGGAFLAASNRSHAPISKSMNLMIKNSHEKQTNARIEAKNAALRDGNRLSLLEDADEEELVEMTPRDPYEKKYDARVEKALESVEVMMLKGLSRLEARGLMEYWAQSGVLRAKVTENSVGTSWALASCGNVGEMQRTALWMRI